MILILTILLSCNYNCPIWFKHPERTGLIRERDAVVLPSGRSYFSLRPHDPKRCSTNYSQFVDKVPTPSNSPCLRPGMRSERGSNWNKAITFPSNSWAIRQEHWSEWRAHKMCIADCLQCSLGLVWRQERSHKPCRSMCVCICADGSVLSPPLSVSTGLHPHLKTQNNRNQ